MRLFAAAFYYAYEEWPSLSCFGRRKRVKFLLTAPRQTVLPVCRGVFDFVSKNSKAEPDSRRQEERKVP